MAVGALTFKMLLWLICIVLLKGDTEMINEKERFSNTNDPGNRFLRGSGNQQEDLPGCDENGCITDIQLDLEMFVADGWGRTITFKDAKGLKTDIRLFISNLEFQVPMSYMYSGVRGSMFTMYGISYDDDGGLYESCVRCDASTDLEYGIDVHGNNMNEPNQNNYGQYSDYSYCKARNIYQYSWFNFGAPGVGKCTNKPAYADIWMCIHNRMAYYFDNTILAFSVDKDVMFKGDVNVEINGEVRTAKIDSTMNNGYSIELGDDITLKIEGWGTLPIPNLDSFVLFKCKNTLANKNGENVVDNCVVEKHMVSNSVQDKGVIPRSGMGEYQIVRPGSKELLYDKSKLVGFPDIKSFSSQRDAAIYTGNDLDDVENFAEMNDQLINGVYESSKEDMYKTINTEGVPDITDENSTDVKNNAKCPFVITSPSLKYIDVIASNYKDMLESYKSYGPIMLENIKYEEQLPVLRELKFRSLMTVKTSAKLEARGVTLEFTNDEGTINGLKEIKSVIMVNAAGSYTKFSFEYMGSGGNVKISSENLQLGTQSYYCSRPSEYTLIISIRSNDGTGKYPLCVNSVCINLSPEYHEPGDGGTDEPGVGGEDGGDSYYYSFMKYQFTGIISTTLAILVIVLDVIIGIIVFYACAKFIARISIWTLWLLVFCMTLGRVNIGGKVDAAPTYRLPELEDGSKHLRFFSIFKEYSITEEGKIKIVDCDKILCTVAGVIEDLIGLAILAIVLIMVYTFLVRVATDAHYMIMVAMINLGMGCMVDADIIAIPAARYTSAIKVPMTTESGTKMLVYGELMGLSTWEARYGKLEDITNSNKQLAAMTSMYGYYSFGPNDIKTLHYKDSVARLQSIKNEAANWPNFNEMNDGLLAVLLTGDRSGIKHGVDKGSFVFYSDKEDNFWPMLRKIQNGDMDLLDQNPDDHDVKNKGLNKENYEKAKVSIREGGQIKTNDKCYIYKGNYLLPATLREGALFVRCTWVMKNDFRTMNFFFLFTLIDKSALYNEDIIPGRIRTSSLSNNYNALTITFSGQKDLINSALVDEDIFYNEVFLRFYVVEGSHTYTMSCSRLEDSSSVITGCQMLIECYDQCKVKRVEKQGEDVYEQRSGSKKQNSYVSANSTLSEEGKVKKSKIILSNMKSLYNNIIETRENKITYEASRNFPALISEFWNSTDYSMKFSHGRSYFKVKKLPASSHVTATKVENMKERFRAMANLADVVVAGEELIKKRKYNTFLEMYDTNIDMMYYRGNVFESTTGGPVLLNCLDSAGISLCNKKGMIAKVFDFDQKQKGERSIKRSTKSEPRTVYNTKYELNIVEGTGLLPNVRDCTGLIIWNDDGQVTTNQDCAVITDNDWNDFAVIDPGKPYKLDLKVYNKWTDPVDEKKLRSWTGTYDTEFESRVTTRKGCERCMFSCMQRCSKNVWPGAHWSFWFSWLIIAAGGMIMALLSKLLNIRVNTNFRRYASKSYAFVKDAGDNVTNGNMKFWKSGDARDKYLEKYKKYDKRDKEAGYIASKNSVKNNYKQDLENDKKMTSNMVEGVSEKLRTRKPQNKSYGLG